MPFPASICKKIQPMTCLECTFADLRLADLESLFLDYLYSTQELEKWVAAGRARMTELSNPDAKFEGEERVLATMQLGDDIR